jgi:DNA-binding CsgD family transcriptional regulator
LADQEQGVNDWDTRVAAEQPAPPGGRTSAEQEPKPGELLADLLWLREQLEALASTPVVMGAHRLAAEVAPVLEPVWSILVEDAGRPTGVGFLRRLPASVPEEEEATRANANVTIQAVRRFRSLDLAGPSMREVWIALSRPAHTLVRSVQSPLRSSRHVRDDDQATRRATIAPTVRPILPGLLGSWDDDDKVVPALRSVLRRWCDLARFATGERREAARLTLAAALLARGAVLDGDVATVKWFIDRWLGLAPTRTRVDGASAALLEDGWRTPTVDDVFSAVRDAVTALRIEALYQHRLHRPVWETEIRGKPVALLSDVVRPQSGDGAAGLIQLADMLVDEQEWTEGALLNRLFLPELVEAVLHTLSARERAVILLFAAGTSKVQTARELGMTRYRVDQVLDRTLSKLRHRSRADKFVGFLEE